MSNNQQNQGLKGLDAQSQQEMEIGKRLKRIKNKIVVMSGKGGVGKSSVAAFLSISLAKKGYRVGLMDVDLHGPSIPRMLGINANIAVSPVSGKAMPIEPMPNLQVISIESIMGTDKDAATIWRGPIKIGVIRQFISDMDWAELDYLVIDSPPGTGDEPLTIAQTIKDAKALIVTTPQEISIADVRKSINFCRQVNMEMLGVVENMNGLKCPHCGEAINLFKSDGGKEMAEKAGVNLLASLPIEPEVVKLADTGRLSELYDAGIGFSDEFNKMVEQIISRTEKAQGV
ncbi:MAG: Mrp/NBP35 family ATP-binding protein [Deltaproteobacteria bacterium]|nr:Mrp/NBP35 family ATP-binding protein [Deltaproteobacteria bacterium]